MCGTRWYGSVIPVAPVSFRAQITTKLYELKTALDARRAQWRAETGASTDVLGAKIHALSVALQGQTSMHTPIKTYPHTREEKTIILKYTVVVAATSDS